MKSTAKKSLVSLLLLALLLTSVSALAYAEADWYETMNLNFTVGTYKRWCVCQVPPETGIEGLTYNSGNCPGMSFEINDIGDAVFIYGTPTQAGDYTVIITVHDGENESTQITINCHVIDVEPTPTPSPTPTPTPTPSPTPVPKVTVTKHPTAETVTEGGTAYFIAKADNATEIIWRLVSPDGKTTIDCANAKSTFSQLVIDGLKTDTLCLSKIPYELNGWKVEAKFNGEGGPVFSSGALLTVKRAELQAPVISAQPTGAKLESGGSVTLSVKATSPDGKTLKYQWYRNTVNSNGGGTAVSGAEGASFTPPEIVGDSYYYVSIWAVDDDRESARISSAAALVSYAEQKATPTPAPTATPEQKPEQSPEQTPQSAVTPRATAPTSVEPVKKDHTVAIVIGAVAAVAIICGTVIFLTLRRRDD